MRSEVIVQKNPKSPIAESFRTLRTNLQFINSKKSLKTLLVTSTLPGEGKSWVAANLALTFAKAGKKVILIDADMRKGRQHEIFGVENETGLSNFLSGIDEEENVEVSKYIQRTEEPGLYIISKGTTPPNPSELLTSDVTIRMIAELEEMFDLIIFDGTPSLIVTDAIILSRLVDSTLIVAEYNITKKDNISKVKRDIENVGGKIAGVVINKIPKQGKKYYGSSYYYTAEETALSTNVKDNRNVFQRHNELETKIEIEPKPVHSKHMENEPEASQDDRSKIIDKVNEYLNRNKK